MRQLNREIDLGDTYPMTTTFESPETFTSYWFQNFAAVMVLGHVNSLYEVEGFGDDGEKVDWEKVCLGTFYIKPNYPGRSSHVCNAGFLVSDGSRGKGVGRLMGEAYLDWVRIFDFIYSLYLLHPASLFPVSKSLVLKA